MAKKQYVVYVLLSAALMLCLGGCHPAENPLPLTTTVAQTENVVSTTAEPTVSQEMTDAATAAETTGLTEPTGTEPPQTEPTQAETVQTEPSETEPVQTESAAAEPEPTEPIQTEPPHTEPIQTEQIQAQTVLDRAAAALAVSMPEVKHDPGWSGGTVVRMPVPLNLAEEAMGDLLASNMRDLFTDALAGEDPQENVEYTYSLAYSGLTEDQSSHLFEVSYTSVGQPAVEIDFDSGAVVAQTTQGVLNSTEVAVTVFDGSGYAACVEIRVVPYFYSTQEAVECLTGAVETEIYTQNILGAEYDEFCIVYDSEEETCHVFLLYLK